MNGTPKSRRNWCCLISNESRREEKQQKNIDCSFLTLRNRNEANQFHFLLFVLIEIECNCLLGSSTSVFFHAFQPVIYHICQICVIFSCKMCIFFHSKRNNSGNMLTFLLNIRQFICHMDGSDFFLSVFIQMETLQFSARWSTISMARESTKRKRNRMKTSTKEKRWEEKWNEIENDDDMKKSHVCPINVVFIFIDFYLPKMKKSKWNGQK